MELKELGKLLTAAESEISSRRQLDTQLAHCITIIRAGLVTDSEAVERIIERCYRGAHNDKKAMVEEFWKRLSEIAADPETTFETMTFMAVLTSVAKEVKKLRDRIST